MTKVWLKRLIVGVVLITSIFGLAYLKSLSAETGYEELTRLANHRKQKTDYKNLFDRTLYKSIVVEFSDQAFDDLITSMETYFETYGSYQDNTMVPVTMTYYDGLGNQFTLEEVGFRTKSNTSRNIPLTEDWRGRPVYYQTSFQLQFNETFDYDSDSNEYGVLKKREAFNLNQLNFEYSKVFEGKPDQAMISEAFSYALYRDAGVTVSQASYGLVYFKIHGELKGFGFYTFIEPIDQSFLEKQFDSNVIGDYGDLFKCTDIEQLATLKLTEPLSIGINQNDVNERYTYSLKNNQQKGLRTDFSDFEAFLEAVNDDRRFEQQIDDYLDVDAFLRALAMGFLIGNSDDYRFNYNNYYLYFDVYTQKVTYIPFDLDSSLGFGKHIDMSGNYGIDYGLLQYSEQAILVDKLLKIDRYKEIYLTYLKTFAETLFDETAFEAEYLQAKALYEPVLILDNHLGNQRFDLRNSITYIEDKKNFVLAQFSSN